MGELRKRGPFGRRKWTEEEDAYLRRWWRTRRTMHTIAECLGRTPSSCAQRAHKLGLSRPHKPGPAHAEAVRLYCVEGMTYAQAGKEMGLTGERVRKMVRRMEMDRQTQGGETMTTLTGHDALDALRDGRVESLNKYADPTEDAREGLTLEEAEDVAREDPSLLWVGVRYYRIFQTQTGVTQWAGAADSEDAAYAALARDVRDDTVHHGDGLDYEVYDSLAALNAALVESGEEPVDA